MRQLIDKIFGKRKKITIDLFYCKLYVSGYMKNKNSFTIRNFIRGLQNYCNFLFLSDLKNDEIKYDYDFYLFLLDKMYKDIKDQSKIIKYSEFYILLDDFCKKYSQEYINNVK